MSHADHVTKIPKNFKKIASTKDSKYTIIENSKLKRFGVQFHPEVTHTTKGKILLKNFADSNFLFNNFWKISLSKEEFPVGI